MSSTPFILSHSYRSDHSISRFISRSPAILRAWLPALIFSCIFVVESTAALGADHTSKPLHDFFRFFMGSAVDNGWTYTHHYIRKIGHFSAYGTFSLICFRGFWFTLRNTANRLRRSVRGQLAIHAMAIAATILVASADEIHQTFLPNRTGTYQDVILDASGALALQVLLFIVLRMVSNWPRKPVWSHRSVNSKSQRLLKAKSPRRLPIAA